MKTEQLITFLNNYKIEEGEPYLEIDNRIDHKTTNRMWTTTGWTVEYSHPNPWNCIEFRLEGKDLHELLMEIYTDITKTGIARREREVEKMRNSL